MKLYEHIRALRAEAKIKVKTAEIYHRDEVWPRLQQHRKLLLQAEELAQEADRLQREYIYQTDQVIRENKINRDLVDQIARSLGHPPSVEELQGILKEMHNLKGGQSNDSTNE